MAARIWESSREEAQAAALNAQAHRCRRLADATYNREMADMLRLMAEDYERSAAELLQKRA